MFGCMYVWMDVVKLFSNRYSYSPILTKLCTHVLHAHTEKTVERIFKLEGHSVERIYFRQRCSDASVNKTILKPRFAVAARRDFPDVKFRVAAHSLYDIRESNPVPASGL